MSRERQASQGVGKQKEMVLRLSLEPGEPPFFVIREKRDQFRAPLRVQRLLGSREVHRRAWLCQDKIAEQRLMLDSFKDLETGIQIYQKKRPSR